MSKKKKKMQKREIHTEKSIGLLTAFINLIIAVIQLIAIVKIQN